MLTPQLSWRAVELSLIRKMEAGREAGTEVEWVGGMSEGDMEDKLAEGRGRTTSRGGEGRIIEEEGEWRTFGDRL